jgi:hypothetical protein
MDRARRTNEAKRNACRILVRKPEGKKLLGKPKPVWDGNIEINFREVYTRLIWFRIGISGGLS